MSKRNLESSQPEKTADALVIGGGVIGLSIARSLALRRFGKITLLERSHLGAEASSAAGGMLAPQSEADSVDEFFKLACASRDMYPALAGSLLEQTGINIEFDQTGTLYSAFTEHDLAEIAERYRWQSEAGLAVEWLTRDEVRAIEPAISKHVLGALRFSLDTQVENRRLVDALGKSAEMLGVKLHLGVYVDSLISGSSGIEGVRTSKGSYSAPVVVVANGAWAGYLLDSDKRVSGIRIEPVRGQMLCLKSNSGMFRHDLFQHVLVSARGYVIPRLDGRVIAGSTTEHAGFEKRVNVGGINSITKNALEIAPSLGNLEISDSWAGLRPLATGGLPVIGEHPDVNGLYLATGHYRNGILLAPATGKLLAEEITTRQLSPLLNSFRPERNQTHATA